MRNSKRDRSGYNRLEHRCDRMQDNGINSDAKHSETRKEHQRVLNNMQSRRDNPHTRDDKRRLINEENVVH